MGKSKKEKPELTLESLNRAIRTYQRDDVLYLIQHGILKDIPTDEKLATYQQLSLCKIWKFCRKLPNRKHPLIRKCSAISRILLRAKCLSTSA